MKLSRRSFLGGALAFAAVAQLPFAADAAVPVIYGDGVRDDWAGLQAALDGKPFRMESSGAVLSNEGVVRISGGTFLISRTLTVAAGSPRRAEIHGSTFARTPDFKGSCFVRFSAGSHVNDCRFDWRTTVHG